MRAAARASMDKVCEVQRAAVAPDGAGGRVRTWATVATVACRLVPTGVFASEGHSAAAQRLTASGQWAVTLPQDTVVYARDRLLISGRIYEITFVAAGGSNETARRVLAVDVV